MTGPPKKPTARSTPTRRNFYKVEKGSREQIGCTSRRRLLMQSA
jgi:hypothetical protein